MRNSYCTPPLPEARHAILAGLRILARLDPDHASERNDVGFSAADSVRGRALASRKTLSDREASQGLDLISCYWRQLPADLFTAATRRAPPPTLSDALDAFAALGRRTAA